MTGKPLFWVGSSLDDLRAFPDKARLRAGYQLRRIQEELDPSDWRPMYDLGAGVTEIRIHTGRQHRLFYVAKFEEAIYVLHACEKKTRRTAKKDLETVRRRYSNLVRRRHHT
jgi:phage-related protein